MKTTGIKGFSLLEALAAIAIVGMALLVSTNALQSHARLARRAELQQEMLQSAEDALETLRGSDEPLDEFPVQLSSQADARPIRTVHTIVRVESLGIEGLYRVTVRSRAHFIDEPMQVELTTMVWRP